MSEFCSATVRPRSRPELTATRYHPIYDQLGYAKPLSKRHHEGVKASMATEQGFIGRLYYFLYFIHLSLNHLNMVTDPSPSKF